MQLQKDEGISANGFDAEFGFEDFYGGLRGAQQPTGEAIGVFLGKEFTEVIEGHGTWGFAPKNYHLGRLYFAHFTQINSPDSFFKSSMTECEFQPLAGVNY